MIKNWTEFIREFIENSENIIDVKMQELSDLVSSFSDRNILYEWENKNDHELTINFTNDNISFQYTFDVDNLTVSKVANGKLDFQTGVESIDEGLDVIEKDIYLVLGVSESYKGEWDSSIKWEEAHKSINDIVRISKIVEKYNLHESDDLISEVEGVLKNYDEKVIEFVIDSLFFNEYDVNVIDGKTKEIIRLGDLIMDKFGTEPFQIINAINDAIRVVDHYYYNEESISEAKSKTGRKVPGKYRISRKR